MSKSGIRRILSTGDKNFIEVVSHSLWAISILGIATGIQFIFDFLMARNFGASGTGIFYLCFSVVVTLSLFGHLGLDRTVVRLIPPKLKEGDKSTAQAIKNTTLRIATINTILIMILLFLASPWLANTIFNNSELVPYLRIFALALPAYSLRYLYGGILRSIKRTRESLIVERIIIYSIGVVSIYTLGNIFNLTGMAIGFVAGSLASVYAGWHYTKKYFPKSPETSRFNKKILLASGIPLLFVAVATQMNGQVSILILGAQGNSADVGIYAAALKVSLVLSLILTAINTIAGTTISELYAKNNKSEMESIFSKTSALGFLMAIPLFLLMVIFPKEILSLFGSEFVSGYSTLIVLALGQLINIVVGPTLFILAMTGHEKALAKAIGVSLIFNIVIGLALIPSLNVFGAGLSTAIAMVIANIIMLLLVKHYLDVWSLPFKSLNNWFKTVVGR